MTSGYFTPIANMPDWLQTFSLVNPMRYFCGDNPRDHAERLGFLGFTHGCAGPGDFRADTSGILATEIP